MTNDVIRDALAELVAAYSPGDEFFSLRGTRAWEAARAALAQPADDGMCPNCVTPWKCNGPHIAPGSAAALAQRADEPVAPIAMVKVYGCYDAAQIPLEVRGVYQIDGFTTGVYVNMPSGACAPFAPAAPAYVPLSEREIFEEATAVLGYGMLDGETARAATDVARAIESLVVARMRGER